MDIKAKLRSLLIKEGAHKGNRLGCVMVFLYIDKDKWDELQDSIKEEDLYLPEGETGYGKEKDPHVTILYGLDADIPDEDIEKEIKQITPPEIKLGKVSSFENDKFDVLKIDIVSDDLHELNKKFKEFPFKSDYPDYIPHLTLAYTNKGAAKKYIDKLNSVGEIAVKPTKIVYSKANGEKKEYNLQN